MPMTTAAFDCAPGAYQLICTGKTSAIISFRTRGGGRIAIAPSLPTPSTEDYATFNSNYHSLELGVLALTDKVYFMADTSPSKGDTSPVKIQVCGRT